jgi:hypothetical protein
VEKNKMLDAAEDEVAELKKEVDRLQCRLDLSYQDQMNKVGMV